jgi:hypothetical protein
MRFVWVGKYREAGQARDMACARYCPCYDDKYHGRNNAARLPCRAAYGYYLALAHCGNVFWLNNDNDALVTGLVPGVDILVQIFLGHRIDEVQVGVFIARTPLMVRAE